MTSTKNILQDFPSEDKLLQKHKPESSQEVYKVNNHLHTPYSFSAFQDISQMFEMAREENIPILGVNDISTYSGYDEFYQLSLKHKIMPLFNIEFIGLLKDLQEKNQRVNDPKNPGRTYFTGKGLNYPLQIKEESARFISNIKAQGGQQVKEMIEKANAFFQEINIPLKLDFEDIKKQYTRELIRERHLALAIQDKISQMASSEEEMKSLLKKIYEGKETQVDLTDKPALQDEIRSNLLKKGGKAFVPEDDEGFPSIKQIMDTIIDGGGIPCYPVLLDNKKGEFNDFEGDWQAMYWYLTDLNVGCIELIPGRNSSEVLNDFVHFFNERNFIITFGTEHNTPALKPLTVTCRNNVLLSDEMQRISFEGAAVIAAHQYKMAKGMEGFLTSEHEPKLNQKNQFIDLGKAVIKEFISR